MISLKKKKKPPLTLTYMQTFTDRFVHFDIPLDYLDLHSRSQLYEEIKNFGVHVHANISMDLDEVQYVAVTCWFMMLNVVCTSNL